MMTSFPIEFIHRATFENSLICESVCRYCNLLVGASPRLEYLHVIEGAHSCPERVRARTEMLSAPRRSAA